MRLRITRRRLIIALLVAIAIAFISFELYLLSASVRLAVVRGADWMGSHEFLAGRLADRDLQVRSEAGEALLRHGASSVPALVEMLEDHDPGNRRIAAATLGKIGAIAVDAYQPLLHVAEEDEDDGVVETAGQALGLVARDHPNLVLELLMLLECPEEDKRLASIRAAATLGDSRAVPKLIASLTHPSPRVREEAAESLGALKALSVTAIPDLIKNLDDPVAEVRSEAQQAISKIIKAAAAQIKPETLREAKKALEKTAAARNSPR